MSRPRLPTMSREAILLFLAFFEQNYIVDQCFLKQPSVSVLGKQVLECNFPFFLLFYINPGPRDHAEAGLLPCQDKFIEEGRGGRGGARGRSVRTRGRGGHQARLAAGRAGAVRETGW